MRDKKYGVKTALKYNPFPNFCKGAVVTQTNVVQPFTDTSIRKMKQCLPGEEWLSFMEVKTANEKATTFH